MPTYVYECAHGHGRAEIDKPMGDATRPEHCLACLLDHDGPGGYTLADKERSRMRRVYTPQRIIVRPTGHGLKPGERTSIPGLAFDDFRYEMERGELRDDPSPVRMTPEEIARFDDAPIDIPPDPERDRALHQLVAQHWTEDLSDDTVRRRELAMNAAKPHPTT